ncbi:hypothetical protein ACK03K_17200 [[Kitasatospora] papulosa]|uniref:hypothetical protein n=1 Tax=Streptomyces TaxID=1883 RepID=UPI00131DAC84|nr:hypothetical protein [Streptomyces sp. NRRL S-325]
MNSSISESVISVSRTWHSVDSSVYRTGPAAARRSEGYSYAGRLSGPSAPGSAFSSVKNVPRRPLSASVLASSAIRSYSRERVAADSRPTVAAQNRSSKVAAAS